MKEDEDRIPAIGEALMASPTEASLRLQVTDLLLGDVGGGRPTLEQRDVLEQIEAALQAYGSFFYPPERR